MTTNDSSLKKNELLLIAVLTLLAMGLITIAVVPSLRTSAKTLILGSERQVLAKVSGKVSASGPQITVLKIRTQNTLTLEVYHLTDEGSLVLMSKIPLFEAKDGHFFVQGNATNLALTDVDNDGTLEIVAPSYDEQMVPRLNVFKYNESNQSFDRVSAPEGFKL